MKLALRCLPLGSFPYDSIESTTKMAAKLFEKMPFIPYLPKIDENDTVIRRTLKNIPGIGFKDNKLLLKTSSSSYKQGMTNLDLAYNQPTLKNLEPFAIEAPFMEKFFQMIKKFESPNALVNLLGPFSIAQMLQNAAEEQMLADKTYRKLFIQSVCVKALWIIKKIEEICPKTVPIIMLEEPYFPKLGDLKRENEDVTSELVTSLFARVIEKLKEHNAIVGVQCLDKCDWQVPINAGVDIISFDAYNNPNNLCIIPELVTEFTQKGGKINWGIVPVVNEYTIKNLNIDSISKRFFATLEGLIIAGVPANLVYNSALVSIQGNTENLPIIFAEKAVILATQLAKRIPTKKNESINSD